jgi:hypothetical protein
MAVSSLGVVSGIQGTLLVDGTTINLEYHETEEIVEDINSTNFGSQFVAGAAGANTILAKEGTTGVGYVRWAIRGKWDANANQFGTPPNLNIGVRTFTGGFQLVFVRASSRGYTFGAVRILRAKTTTNAQTGAITYECSGESQGTWSRAA